MIVVDTNVWSETLRPEPDPRVIAWMRANAAELHLPALVVHELRYGLAILPDGRHRADLTERVEAMLSRLAGRVLPYDADVAATHVHLRADARAPAASRRPRTGRSPRTPLTPPPRSRPGTSETSRASASTS